MQNAVEQMIVVTPDMSCGHCVSSIEGDVSALVGVQSVKADLPTKSVTISFDPGKVTSVQIEAALNEAGFPAAK